MLERLWLTAGRLRAERLRHEKGGECRDLLDYSSCACAQPLDSDLFTISDHEEEENMPPLASLFGFDDTQQRAYDMMLEGKSVCLVGMGKCQWAGLSH